jgi:hypothetical protein
MAFVTEHVAMLRHVRYCYKTASTIALLTRAHDYTTFITAINFMIGSTEATLQLHQVQVVEHLPHLHHSSSGSMRHLLVLRTVCSSHAVVVQKDVVFIYQHV